MDKIKYIKYLVVCLIAACISTTAYSQNDFPPDGNVGIGTSIKPEKLTVNGNISIVDGFSYNVHPPSGASWANKRLIFHGWNGSADFTEIQVPGGGLNGAQIRLNSNGNVGIGTTNPQAKLAVNGGILAQEIKVKTDISVPDYVFDSDYKMLSLAEIENYVKEHKHLPEIPSAKTIGKEGLDLAEMNLLLLKKVEELTLYLIELKKEINILKKRDRFLPN
jgi:hypothetical protein